MQCAGLEFLCWQSRSALKPSDINHSLEQDFSTSLSFMHYPHVDISSISPGLWRELCQTKHFLNKDFGKLPGVCVLGKPFLPHFCL